MLSFCLVLFSEFDSCESLVWNKQITYLSDIEMNMLQNPVLKAQHTVLVYPGCSLGSEEEEGFGI